MRELFGDLARIVDQHGVTGSLYLIHGFVFFWLIFDALSQTQSYTSLLSLFLWFLSVHSVQNKGQVNTRVIFSGKDASAQGEDDQPLALQPSMSIGSQKFGSQSALVRKWRSRLFHTSVSNWLLASMMCTGAVILCLFVVVLEWSVS